MFYFKKIFYRITNKLKVTITVPISKYFHNNFMITYIFIMLKIIMQL